MRNATMAMLGDVIRNEHRSHLNRTRGGLESARGRRRQSPRVVELLEDRTLLNFTPIAQPGDPLPGGIVYSTATGNLASDISGDGSTTTALTDGTQTVAFSESMTAGTVGTTWSTWNSPPRRKARCRECRRLLPRHRSFCRSRKRLMYSGSNWNPRTIPFPSPWRQISTRGDGGRCRFARHFPRLVLMRSAVRSRDQSSVYQRRDPPARRHRRHRHSQPRYHLAERGRPRVSPRRRIRLSSFPPRMSLIRSRLATRRMPTTPWAPW